ncbi:MAG TPA: site-2 protease family protein [Fimbriiglobus sp.]|jgi:Zn-dependent protease
MFRSLELGRPFGIRLAVHWSFWILPAVVFASGFLTGSPNMAVFDVATILGMFTCVVLHELGHALAARGFGIRTHDIQLYPIGGVARLDRMPEKPYQELAVALAGPAVNVAIILFVAPLMLFGGYGIGLNSIAGSWVEAFWHRMLWVNIGLFLFNMLPAFPMDGGRVLRAILALFVPRTQATEVAANVGTVFAGLFFLAGMFTLNPILMVLAWFVFLTGRAELRAVRDMEAGPRRARRTGPNQSQAGDLLTGWVFEPMRGAWVEYRLGVPIRIVRS